MKRVAFLPNSNTVVIDDDGVTPVPIINMDLQDLKAHGIHAVQYDPVADTYEVEYIHPANRKMSAAEFKAAYGDGHVATAVSKRAEYDQEQARLAAAAVESANVVE